MFLQIPGPPWNPDAAGPYLLDWEAVDPYMLEVLEELNENLVSDTAEITAAHFYMLIAGFYHLVMLGPWKKNFYHQMQAVRAKGLLNQSDFSFINAVG